jgi:putative ABC transport system ATP-binding protein
LVVIGLQDRRQHRPAQLSGGEQQRVALARALMIQPAVIFADEPTGNLDSAASEIVLDQLRRAVDQFGRTLALVTHDPIAAAHADRIVFLRDGAVVRETGRRTAPEILDVIKSL